MTEIRDGSDDPQKDHNSQAHWVPWVVGISTVTLLFLSVSFFIVILYAKETEPMGGAVVTDPSELASLSSEREAYEREWERQHGREYSPSRTSYADDGVAVLENLDPGTTEPTTE